jgi:PDZ domain-containing secreted protein
MTAAPATACPGNVSAALPGQELRVTKFRKPRHIGEPMGRKGRKEMGIRNRGSKPIEREGHSISREFFSGLAMAIALLVAGAGVSHGQETPEPPEPPEPPEAAQVIVLNDGAAHLGVSLGEVTTEKAQELKLPAVAGAIVSSVQKESAAAKAGIETGDAIIEFDGIRVRSSAELRRLIRETPAGRTVEMKIVRDGKTRVVSAKMEANPEQFNYNYNGPEIRIPSINMPKINIPPLDFSGFWDHRVTLGISADDLTPQLAQYFGVKQGKGILISEVTKGGAADKAGLKAGDVIVLVDGQPISGVEELRANLNDNFTGDTRKVSLTIVRDRHEQSLNVDLTRSPAGGKRNSSATVQSYDQTLAQLREQIQDEAARQNQQMHGEWQRQLQEQMKSLKDQLRQMQDLRVTPPQEGEL